MRKDVREFIRRLEAAGLTVESAPGHYHVLRDGKPLRKQNGMPFTLPFSPDTIRWQFHECSLVASTSSEPQRRSPLDTRDLAALVVSASNIARTQNGHIRNDTRDV